MPYPPITAERLAAYATLGLEGLLTEENKELLAEVIHLREQLAELTKCECRINTNWHEGVPYDYKVTCSHCDTQLQASKAVVVMASDAMNSTCKDPEWVGLYHIRLDWIELVNREIKAYRATQATQAMQAGEVTDE